MLSLWLDERILAGEVFRNFSGQVVVEKEFLSFLDVFLRIQYSEMISFGKHSRSLEIILPILGVVDKPSLVSNVPGVN